MTAIEVLLKIRAEPHPDVDFVVLTMCESNEAYGALIEVGMPSGNVYRSFLALPPKQKIEVLDRAIYILQQEQL